MKTVANYLMPLGFLICTACSTSFRTEHNVRANAPNPPKEDTISAKQYRWKRDLKTIEYCELVNVKCNEIDSNLNNYVLDSLDYLGESTEGGQVKYYSRQGDIMKMEETNYGEMGQNYTSYYIRNNKLIFSLESQAEYEVPITHPQFNKKEWYSDTTKYYFRNNKTFDMFTQDCGAPSPRFYVDSLGNEVLNNFKNRFKMFKKRK